MSAIDELRRLSKRLRDNGDRIVSLGSTINAAIAEIEQLRQERDGLRARVAELVEVGTNCCDETPICQQEWNNAIAGASGVDTSIKVKAIHDSVAWLAKNYNHLAHPVCGLLTHYANQIEDAAMAKEQGDGN